MLTTFAEAPFAHQENVVLICSKIIENLAHPEMPVATRAAIALQDMNKNHTLGGFVLFLLLALLYIVCTNRGSHVAQEYVKHHLTAIMQLLMKLQHDTENDSIADVIHSLVDTHADEVLG